MEKELKSLANILRQNGYVKYAGEVDNETKRIKIKVDPLTFAVSQGLLNPQVLSILDEEGHEEDMSEFQELLDELQTDSENPDSDS